MKFYKSHSGAVYAYESSAERGKLGSPDLIEMNAKEIEAHLNPKPTSEQLDLEARAERSILFAETDWMVIRHRDEIEEGVTASLSPEQYSSIQAYRRALRDITEQSGFPKNINWPAKLSF